MANEQNLRPPWKPGQTGNPKGRPCVDQKLREMRDAFGEWPREELMRMAKDKRLRPETRMRVLQYLDEQFNGKPKRTTDTQMRVEGDLDLLLREIDGKSRTLPSRSRWARSDKDAE